MFLKSRIKLLRYLGSSTYEMDWEEIQMKTGHYFLAILKSDKQDRRQQETYEKGVLITNEWINIDEGLELLTFENNTEINELIRNYIKQDVFV